MVWRPAIDAWTARLHTPDTWEPISRNAFGTMRLRSATTGSTVTIHPARGWVFPDRAPEEIGPDDLDVFDVDDKPLHLRASARLGPVDADTLYGFVPALGVGGEPRLECLRIVEAVSHVVELAAITPLTIFPTTS